MNKEIQKIAARNKKRQHLEEKIVANILKLTAIISVTTTLGIIIVLFSQSLIFFENISPWEFLTGTKWTPLFRPAHFGVLPLIGGTFLVAFIAAVVALTLGIGAAIFLSEYAPERLRKILKPVLEVLAGIPTVVYGYFALTFVTPILKVVFGQDNVIIFNALSAGLVMGLMIMPMVSTLSEDAMVAVPKSLRDGAYALGATKFEVSTKIVFPAALSGIVASFVLALSRAIGETMIVKIAAGSTPNLTLNPLESIQAMTGYIVAVSQGETPHGSVEYGTIFAVGLLLFVLTFIMNIIGRVIISKFRQVYE
tara:strand:- start:153 stop:1079 length:927 start_codon:yes stop_codon:yes gene_type:complete